MKSFKKIISSLLILCMFASLLPVHFALAAKGITTEEEINAYILGRADSVDAIASGASGHVWELKEESGQPYDYSLTIYARNIEANAFCTNLRYNPTEVDLVDSAGEVFDRETYEGAAEGWYDFGGIVNGMTSGSATDITALMEDAGASGAENAYQDSIDSSYERLYLALAVKSLASKDKPKWTVADSGAKYSESTLEPGTYLYKTPTDVNCPMFKIYFKRKAGVSQISDSTIKLAYDDITNTCGGAGQFPNGTTGADAVTSVSEGVYLVGFPKATIAPQKVTLKVVDSTTQAGINGATVKIYKDEACTDLVKELVTNSSGVAVDSSNVSADVTLEAETQYYYTATMTGYGDSKATGFYVGTTELEVPAMELTPKSAMTYDVTIKVRDADDTTVALSGAQIYLNREASPISDTTAADGTVKLKLNSGTNYVKAERSGYTASDFESFTVKEDNTTVVNVDLVPERATITLPVIKDNKGQPVAGAQVTLIKKSDNETQAWGTQQTISGDALNSPVAVPKETEFRVLVDVPGYDQQTIYLKVDAVSNATYYTDETLKNEFTEDHVTVAKVEDPFYTVDIEKGADNETYTAKVYLSNLSGFAGIFGLRYDKEVFTLDAASGFQLGSTDKIKLVESEANGKDGAAVIPAQIVSEPNDPIAYHLFQWQSILKESTDDGNIAMPLDTVTNPKTLIATYTFKMKSGKDETDIVSDAFTVMPFDKTKNAAKQLTDIWENDYADAYASAFKAYWRYVDDQNDESKHTVAGEVKLPEGRISDKKATLNGFYQVNKTNANIIDEKNMMDVQTIINYTNFDAKKAALNFIVTSEADNQPLANAKVKLNDAEGNLLTELTTDVTGIANYTVDTTAGDITYTYVVSCQGYWDQPETGTVTVVVNNAVPPVTKNEYIKLKEKIYHAPKLKDNGGNEILNTEIVLTGAKYAYNGKDFKFNVEPAPGKKYADGTTLPIVPTVTVKGVTYRYDAAAGETAPLTYDPNNDVYILKGDYIIGDKTGPADAEGFPSDEIIVTIVKPTVEEDTKTFTVNALAGTNGTVAYTANTGDGESEEDSSTTSDTARVLISNIARGGKTGDITFTPDSGYYVEKVLVNGVEIFNDTKNLVSERKNSFAYKFENITMDNSIVVTFWDTITPSKDKIITLVVGDKGTANVTSPDTAAVTNTRKVFLNPTAALEFTTNPTASPAVNGYVLNKVEKEVDGAKTEVSLADGKYTVAAEEGKEVTVYVTFKVEGADDTFNVFVTSYIAEGDGSIAPVGVLIYKKFDSPSFTLTAGNPNSQATAVRVDNKDIAVTRGDTATYTLVSIEKDTTIGAVFSESTYKVQGIIDYSQGTGTSGIAGSAPVQTPATVVFSRTVNGVTTEIYSTDVQTDRSNATFSAEVPQGTWTITVSKQGYLNYIITDFEMTKDTKFLGGETAAKPIVLIVGETSGLGKAISLGDVGIIANGLYQNATSKIRARADVDDDGKTQVGDMTYVMKNYGYRYTKKTYDQFKADAE